MVSIATLNSAALIALSGRVLSSLFGMLLLFVVLAYTSEQLQGYYYIVLKSDGLARRPFCYISDAIIGFLTVLISGKDAEAYNIGNPEAEISIGDLALEIANLRPELNLKVKFDIKNEGDKYIKSPVSRACPSIDKVSRIGWTPSIGIKEGFDRTIKSFS